MRMLTNFCFHCRSIYGCTGDSSWHYINHGVTLPTTEEKIWRLTKTTESISVMCNGVDVLEYGFEDSPYSSCNVWKEERSDSFVTFWKGGGHTEKEYRCE